MDACGSRNGNGSLRSTSQAGIRPVAAAWSTEAWTPCHGRGVLATLLRNLSAPSCAAQPCSTATETPWGIILGEGRGNESLNPSCAAWEGDAAGGSQKLMVQRGSGALHSCVRVIFEGTVHIIPTLLGAISSSTSLLLSLLSRASSIPFSVPHVRNQTSPPCLSVAPPQGLPQQPCLCAGDSWCFPVTSKPSS